MNHIASLCMVALLSLPALQLPAAESSATNSPPLPRTDAQGNPLRRAPTGHVSNYDESKAGAYTLPDPLVLQDGNRVANAEMWFARRRPEILQLYEDKIYGKIPETAPKVRFEVAEAETGALEGSATRKLIVGRFGENATGPSVRINLFLPAAISNPAPVVLHATFFGAQPGLSPPAGTTAGRPRFSESGPITNLFSRGYAYATFRYTDIEGDAANANVVGVRKLALKPGQAAPGSDEWGTISAWAWGISRIIDFLETEPLVDSRRIVLAGHSRLGKTVLWAGARDNRVALTFSSCSGEMGAALARRDYGETIDDMAANFPWQFAGNFQQYAGRWSEMPVDAHMLIALHAPRPVFVTGGTQDQWADPRGQFLALVAAEPVYRLLGKDGVGTDGEPALDAPLISGSLGFHYHTGGHTITAKDWEAFLDFADRHMRGTPR